MHWSHEKLQNSGNHPYHNGATNGFPESQYCNATVHINKEQSRFLQVEEVKFSLQLKIADFREHN